MTSWALALCVVKLSAMLKFNFQHAQVEVGNFLRSPRGLAVHLNFLGSNSRDSVEFF